MTAFTAAFISCILPIILAAGVGVLLGRTTDIQPSSLSKLVLYIFIPCMIYELTTQYAISDREILVMMGFTIVSMVCVTAVMGGLGKAFGWPKSIIAAAMLASLASNAGNYGMTLTQFAFGDKALPYAGLFMVDNGLMTYTLGIAIASWGSGKASNPFIAPFKYPFVYAFLVGLVVTHLGVSMPVPVSRVIGLFSDAAIPTMLILLGLQLNLCEWRKPTLALTLTNLTRLITSPIIAVAVAALFALEGPARQAGVLQAAMPTAVTALLLGTEFGLEPTFLTVTVALSTVFSFITLTPLIVYLS